MSVEEEFESYANELVTRLTSGEPFTPPEASPELTQHILLRTTAKLVGQVERQRVELALLVTALDGLTTWAENINSRFDTLEKVPQTQTAP